MTEFTDAPWICMRSIPDFEKIHETMTTKQWYDSLPILTDEVKDDSNSD